MAYRYFLSLLVLLFLSSVKAQTGPGIGFYPTGTEPGIGLRSSKEAKWMLDLRIAKPAFNSFGTSLFITELSLVHRLVHLEKVRFNLGLGYRGNWNFKETNFQGVVIPVGVEAFPFPFQNAGLVFEVAPYFESDFSNNWNSGFRTVAGFVFYFPIKKTKNDANEKI